LLRDLISRRPDADPPGWCTSALTFARYGLPVDSTRSIAVTPLRSVSMFGIAGVGVARSLVELALAAVLATLPADVV